MYSANYNSDYNGVGGYLGLSETSLLFNTFDRFLTLREPIYMPVNHENRWMVKLTSISIGQTMICRDCHAILDTGSSLIYGPKDKIDKMNIPIFGKSGVDCDDLSTLPTIRYRLRVMIDSKCVVGRPFSSLVIMCWPVEVKASTDRIEMSYALDACLG